MSHPQLATYLLSVTACTLGLYVELSEPEGSLWLPEVSAADLRAPHDLALAKYWTDDPVLVQRLL